MRILHITDIHCSYTTSSMLPDLASRIEAEVVAVTGDFECEEPIDILKELGVRVVAVSGNMDDTYILRLLKELGMSVESRLTRIGGYVFVGISGRSARGSAKRVASLLEEVREPVVLLSHHPPHGTKVDLAMGSVHAGLHEVRDIVERYQPVLHLCGHIHESPGIDRIGRTLVVNPGPYAEGRYAVIELGDEPKARLGKLDLGF